MGKGLFHLANPRPHFVPEEELRNQGRNPEAGAEAEPWRKAACCFPPHGFLGAFLHNSGPSAQRWSRPQWPGFPPCQSLTRRYATDLPLGQSDRGAFSIKVLSCQITLACVKLRRRREGGREGKERKKEGQK